MIYSLILKLKVDKKVLLNYFVLSLPAILTPFVFIFEPLVNLLLDVLLMIFFPDIAALIGPYEPSGSKTHGIPIFLTSNTVAILYAILMIPASFYITKIINSSTGMKNFIIILVFTIFLYISYIFINIFFTNLAASYVRINQ